MSSEGSSILLCPVRRTAGGTHGGPSWHREAGCEDSSWDQDGGANGSPERGGVREIEQLATRVSRILSRLQETESDPAMEKSLDRALKLVTTCQKRSAMHRVCAAGAMARKLRRVQDDILRQLMLGVFATTTQLTQSLNMLQQPGAGAPPPRSQRPSSWSR